MSAKTLGDMPAYPWTQPFGESGTMTVPGMTIRQAFAMAAMQGILANPKCEGTPAELATYSRSSADALLAELAKDQA